MTVFGLNAPRAPQAAASRVPRASDVQPHPVWMQRVVRAIVAVGCLYACLGAIGQRLLASAVPAQALMFQALTAPFELRSFGIEQRGAHIKLRATLVNRQHLVVGSRVVAPGARFEVETPARIGLLFAALIMAGSALVVPAGARSIAVGALVACAASATLAFASLPIILAGQQMEWDVNAFWLEGAMVSVSAFLLHGGGLAVCAAVIWLNAALSGRVALVLARRPGGTRNPEPSTP